MHRDQGFVFDDQNAGRGFLVDLRDGFLRQLLDILGRHVHDFTGLVGREIFECRQKQRLAIERCDRLEPVLGRIFVPVATNGFRHIKVGARPDLVECAIEGHAATFERLFEFTVGQCGFERGTDERVSRGL